MPSVGKTKFEIAVIEKVTEMRRQKGFSQEYIAAILNTTKGFIGQVESQNHPSKYNLNHLNKLAYEMGCSPKEFMPNDPIPADNW
ncbi:MAG: helix-turn-helix domain-containing protein, partial [Chitinophagales bacterium]